MCHLKSLEWNSQSSTTVRMKACTRTCPAVTHYTGAISDFHQVFTPSDPSHHLIMFSSVSSLRSHLFYVSADEIRASLQSLCRRCRVIDISHRCLFLHSVCLPVSKWRYHVATGRKEGRKGTLTDVGVYFGKKRWMNEWINEFTNEPVIKSRSKSMSKES